MENPSVDCPELNAFEAFLALNPEHIQQFLELPLCDFQEHIDNLGFEGASVLDEFFSIQSFDPETWLSPVGLSLDDFLRLTPLQYMECSPDFGAPLVSCILNSIHLDGDHQQLLATAGGTNLTKSEKWAIGGAAAITGLYLLPKLYMHKKLIPIVEVLAGKQPYGADGDYDWTNVKVAGFSPPDSSPLKGLESAAVKRGFWGPQMDLNFKTFGDRLVYELRCTLPGVVKTVISLRRQAAQQQLEHDVVEESRDYTSKHESEIDSNLTRSLDDPKSELDVLSQQSISDDALLRPGSFQNDLDTWAANQLRNGSLGSQIADDAGSAFEQLSDDAGSNLIEREELNLLESVVQADAVATKSFVDSNVEGLDVEIKRRANTVINNEIDSLVDGVEVEVRSDVQADELIVEEDIKADIPDV